MISYWPPAAASTRPRHPGRDRRHDRGPAAAARRHSRSRHGAALAVAGCGSGSSTVTLAPKRSPSPAGWVWPRARSTSSSAWRSAWSCNVRTRHDGTWTLRYVSEVLEVMPPGGTQVPAGQPAVPARGAGRAGGRRAHSVAGAGPAAGHSAIVTLAGAPPPIGGLLLLVREITRRRPAPGTPPRAMPGTGRLSARSRYGPVHAELERERVNPHAGLH
jgi:hypothetical protein